jgi:hypothetical protein
MLTGASSLNASMKQLKRFSPITALVSLMKSSGNIIFCLQNYKNNKKKATDYTDFQRLFDIFATY